MQIVKKKDKSADRSNKKYYRYIVIVYTNIFDFNKTNHQNHIENDHKAS